MEIDVPIDLKNLIKSVVYTFYSSIHMAIINTLTYYSVLDEDTLLELLQIDKKQFRSAIVNLRHDRIIKQTIRKEKDAANGSLCSYVFYHINYYSFLNALRYKLDKMRKNLIKEEKVGSNKAAFSCQNCNRNFSEIEIGKILNMETDEMICYNCGGEVIENVVDQPLSINKCLVAKFNENFEPFFKMIEQCLEIELAPNLLESEITDDLLQRAVFARSNQGNVATSIRNDCNFQKSANASSLFDQSIRINLGDTQKKKSTKTHPVWLEENHRADSRNPILPDMYLDSKPAQSNVLENLVLFESKMEDDVKLSSTDSSSEHEKIDFPETLDMNVIEPKSITSSPNPDIIDDFCAENYDFENIENSAEGMSTPTVHVEGIEYAIDDITEDLITKMSSDEHEKYIKILNELYKNSF